MFHPRARTGKVAKELASLGKPPEEAAGGSAENVGAVMDFLYGTLAIMLTDEEGNLPEASWLEDHVPWDVANELIEFCNPDAARVEGNDVDEILGKIDGLTPSERHDLAKRQLKILMPQMQDLLDGSAQLVNQPTEIEEAATPMVTVQASPHAVAVPIESQETTTP